MQLHPGLCLQGLKVGNYWSLATEPVSHVLWNRCRWQETRWHWKVWDCHKGLATCSSGNHIHHTIVDDSLTGLLEGQQFQKLDALIGGLWVCTFFNNKLYNWETNGFAKMDGVHRWEIWVLWYKAKTYERTKKYAEIGCVQRWKYTKAIICNTIETIKMGYVHPNNVNVNIQLKHWSIIIFIFSQCQLMCIITLIN